MQLAFNSLPTGGQAGQFTLSAQPIFELQAGATVYPVITEIILEVQPNNAASTTVVGIGTPATQGTSRFNSGLVQEDLALTSTLPGLSLITQWTVLPTIPTTYIRRGIVRAFATATVIPRPLRFLFPRGLKMNPSTSIAGWLISTDSNWTGGLMFDVFVGIDG